MRRFLGVIGLITLSLFLYVNYYPPATFWGRSVGMVKIGDIPLEHEFAGLGLLLTSLVLFFRLGRRRLTIFGAFAGAFLFISDIRIEPLIILDSALLSFAIGAIYGVLLWMVNI